MNQRLTQAYTLIEILVSLAATAALVGGIAAVVSPSLQAARSDTIATTDNIEISRSSNQLIDDISGKPVILRQASNERLDFLNLTALKPAQLPKHLGNGKENQIQLDTDAFSGVVGKDVVITNTSGDYLMTKVVSSQRVGSNWLTTFECPLYLPGTLSAHTYTPFYVSHSNSIGGGGQPDSLYRDTGSGWTLADTKISQLSFQPSEGTPFTGNLAPVDREIRELTVTLSSEGDRSQNASTALISPVAFKEWSCGQRPGTTPNNLGDLQLNVMLEGNLNPVNPGATPAVGTSGPEAKSLNRFGTQVFSGLQPGLYNVSASVITIGGNPYDPVITGSPVNIGKGRAGTVNVNYVERRGIMTITVTGLKPGEKGKIHIRGRENKDLELTNGQHPLELLPGQYTVTADPTADSDPTVTPNTVTIRGGVESPVGVNYKEVQGTVTLQVSGLATGQSGQVTIGGRTITVTNGNTTVSLDRGMYPVTAAPVTGYTAKVTPPNVNVTPRTNHTVQVQYTKTVQQGTLNIQVSGLPSGQTSTVSVAGRTFTVTNGTTPVKLDGGSYTVSAAPVTGHTLQVSPPSVTITPNGSHTVQVQYTKTVNTVQQGTLNIQVSGLPSGQTSTVSVAGRTFTVTNGTTPVKLDGGSYTVSAAPVTGHTLQVSPPSVTITPNSSHTVQVQYTKTPPASQAQKGKMAITVRGLTANEKGLVTVTDGKGNNYAAPLGTGTYHIELTPGSYTTSAADVGNKTATVTPVTSVITENGVTNVLVSYNNKIPNQPNNPTPSASVTVKQTSISRSSSVSAGMLLPNFDEKKVTTPVPLAAIMAVKSSLNVTFDHELNKPFFLLYNNSNARTYTTFGAGTITGSGKLTTNISHPTFNVCKVPATQKPEWRCYYNYGYGNEGQLFEITGPAGKYEIELAFSGGAENEIVVQTGTTIVDMSSYTLGSGQTGGKMRYLRSLDGNSQIIQSGSTSKAVLQKGSGSVYVSMMAKRKGSNSVTVSESYITPAGKAYQQCYMEAAARFMVNTPAYTPYTDQNGEKYEADMRRFGGDSCRHLAIKYDPANPAVIPYETNFNVSITKVE